MGGGLMQLVAYGAQDIYLTGNPQITFFKVVYRRHTNFAMEAVEQTLNGNVAAGNKVTATISRNGDLVGRMCVTSATASKTGGSDLVQSAEVEIGGQKIDKQTAIISMSFSVFSVVVGILVSYIFDITPAGTIVLISIGLLGGTMGIKSAGLLSKN